MRAGIDEHEVRGFVLLEPESQCFAGCRRPKTQRDVGSESFCHACIAQKEIGGCKNRGALGVGARAKLRSGIRKNRPTESRREFRDCAREIRIRVHGAACDHTAFEAMSEFDKPSDVFEPRCPIATIEAHDSRGRRVL